MARVRATSGDDQIRHREGTVVPRMWKFLASNVARALTRKLRGDRGGHQGERKDSGGSELHGPMQQERRKVTRRARVFG